MSSMLSAPVTIPATIEATFAAASTPAPPGTVTIRSTNDSNPVSRANRITGTNPAEGTWFTSSKVAATFDEVSLVPSAGLVPVMRLARLTGLESLVDRMVTVPGGAGVDAAAKVASIVAGMVTGADSIDDMDALREGAVGKVLPGVKAAVDVGHVPAGVHLRSCPAIGCGGRRDAGPVGLPGEHPVRS